MQLFSRKPGDTPWQGPADPITGLAAVNDEVSDLVLHVEWPILQAARLAGAVRLTRRLGGDRIRIGIATPHPAGEWLAEAFRAGADDLVICPGAPAQVLLAFLPAARRCRLEDCCPHLHQRIRHNLPMCVCGRHRDRMVLAGHHLDRWCVGDVASCPHRSGGDDHEEA